MRKLALAVLLALSTAACSAGAGSAYKGYSEKLALTPEAASVLGVTGGAADVVIASLPKLQANQQRAALSALISRSDAACETYMAALITDTNVVKTSLGTGSLILSAVGAVTSPVRNANLLAGGATLLGATRNQLADTIIGNQAPALLYSAVMAKRLRERESLLEQMRATTPDFYSVGARITAYHGMCGITVGLESAQEAIDLTRARAVSDAKKDAERLSAPPAS